MTREDIAEYVCAINPNESEKHLRWVAYELCRDKLIQRVSRNQYTLYQPGSGKIDYTVTSTDDTAAIKEAIEGRFPLLGFVVWETYSLNEFLNHQLARNHVFVEVEKPLEESAFLALRERFSVPVLLKPSGNDLYLYSDELTIIVISLTTEAPVSGHGVKIEKLLVDLLANKLVRQIISPGEIPDIFESAFSRYQINRNTLLRYARRRGLEQETKDMMPK